MNRLALFLLLAAPVATRLDAQSVAEYRAPAAPLYWVSDNPFRLFLVRGGDTIPEPVRGISVFRETWRPVPDGFDVIRSSVDVGLSPRMQTDTLTVTRRGNVLRINGRVDYERGEWDALLRLPAAPLRVGLEWSDTLSHSIRGPRGEGVYEIRRSYRITRRIESPDSAGFEVAVDGRLRFELSMWTDSTAGQYRWFELEGPAEERFVFDPASGQLHRRSWSMLLEGIGGDHDGSRTDTLRAGLRSDNSRFRIPEARATALMASLPGADSAITVRADGAYLFVHTFGRDSTGVQEGFRRADGLVGRADVLVAQSRPTRWTFSWVDLGADVRRTTLERHDSALVRDGERHQPPAAEWGVAEYGMVGTLVPSLESLSAAGPTRFAIYRPTAARWDVVRAIRRALPSATLYVLAGESGGQSVILVNEPGILIYEESTSAEGGRTVRFPTSPAGQAEVERAIAALRGAAAEPRRRGGPAASSQLISGVDMTGMISRAAAHPLFDFTELTPAHGSSLRLPCGTASRPTRTSRRSRRRSAPS